MAHPSTFRLSTFVSIHRLLKLKGMDPEKGYYKPERRMCG